ncbi:MAG: tetratricopeptide repeat protein [Planctomycetaceae bacterium]
MKPRIFISSVSSEFRTSRQLIANVLSRLGYDPVWQDIFGTESGDLRQVLRDKIDDCDGLLQLVGRGYGAEPPTADETFGRVSYTQFEFLYARAQGKKTWLIFADDACTRDRPLDELDRSHDPQDPDPVAYVAERRALQEAWQQRWKKESHLFHGVASDIDLELRVERLRDEFAELRREFRWWQQRVTRNLTIVAALVLVSIGIGMYVARQQQQLPDEVAKETGKQVDQAQKEIEQKIDSTAAETKEGIKVALQDAVKELTNPGVLADRIRKEIHATAEAKIEALPDQKGRGRLVAEIEKERDLALGRVDDLIKLIQEGLKQGASPVFQRAAEILQKEGTDAAIEYLESRRPSTLETARRHAEQAKTAQGRADAEKELRNKSLQALVLEAELLETKLQWQPALELREQVAELAPDWFEARNDLGLLHRKLARFREAEPHLRATLKLAANPAEEATALNNLALLLMDTNRLAEAEPLIRRALAIDEQSFGAEHPKVATRLNNLALLLKDTNRVAEAEPLMRRALSINEKSFGPMDLNVAVSLNLNNLALLLKETNRLAEAEQLFRRALIIDEQSYGAEHPVVAVDLNNLATVLLATNRLAEAEPLFRRTLTINEQSYGTAHPNIVKALNNLAHLLQITNRSAEAEPLTRRVLEISEQLYGAEHPVVATALNNLASLLDETNRLAEAEPLKRRALAIDEQSYGAEHPKVALKLNNLAALLHATNRLAEAEPLMARSVTIYQLSGLKTGHQHPNMQAGLANYRNLLQKMELSRDEIGQRVHAALHPTMPLKAITPKVADSNGI